jgi:hypothetical protein
LGLGRGLWVSAMIIIAFVSLMPLSEAKQQSLARQIHRFHTIHNLSNSRASTQKLAARHRHSCDHPINRLLSSTRGGALADDEESDFDSDFEDEEEEDDENDLLGMMDDMDDGEFVDDSDFAEDDVLKRAIAAFVKTPPLTKAYLSASMVATLYGYLMNRNQFPSFLSLEWKPTLTKLQIWRPFTAFLNFGPLGIGYPLTAHFVWEYMSTLERYCHKRPYDFWIMIVFGQLAMIVGYPLLNLSPRFLGHNLSTYLVYIWSRYHEGLGIRLFEAFETRAELLPWFFLAQTFLLEGEPPVLDFLGIVFGHIYHYCKTIGLLRAPPAWVTWYEQSTTPWIVAIRQRYKDISSDFEMVE